MAKKKKQQPAGTIRNRRARFDYDLSDGLVVGIALNGRETKALRMGHGHLRGAYVVIKDGELWLLNATITGAPGAALTEEEKTQSRKLLARKREIAELIAAKTQGQAIIPMDILTHGRYIKVRIAVGRGKKTHDKRQTIKKREEEREARASIKRDIHG
jgi:SsrA-binding protein